MTLSFQEQHERRQLTRDNGIPDLPGGTESNGDDRVHTGGAAVQTLDLESGSYRPSTLADLHAFTRLQDALTNVSWFELSGPRNNSWKAWRF